MLSLLRWLWLAWLGSCAATMPAHATVAPRELPGSDRSLHRIPSRDAYTVLVFFSSHCDVQRAHDARLVQLAEQFVKRGVTFYAIDSETDAALERDAQQARLRGYPFPILPDAHGALAKALGAEYSTYSVLLDPSGHVVYHGGLDSDQTHLQPDATHYLRDALRDVLSGRAPRRNYAAALGCGLRLE